jgi:hypothetical protein
LSRFFFHLYVRCKTHKLRLHVRCKTPSKPRFNLKYVYFRNVSHHYFSWTQKEFSKRWGMKTRRLVMDSGVQVLHVDHIGKQYRQASPEAVWLFTWGKAKTNKEINMRQKKLHACRRTKKFGRHIRTWLMTCYFGIHWWDRCCIVHTYA